jgi:hypothetical protein
LKNAADWGIGDLEIEAAKTAGKFKIFNVVEVPVKEPKLSPQKNYQPNQMTTGLNAHQIQPVFLCQKLKYPQTLKQIAASPNCQTAANPNTLLE